MSDEIVIELQPCPFCDKLFGVGPQLIHHVASHDDPHTLPGQAQVFQTPGIPNPSLARTHTSLTPQHRISYKADLTHKSPYPAGLHPKTGLWRGSQGAFQSSYTRQRCRCILCMQTPWMEHPLLPVLLFERYQCPAASNRIPYSTPGLQSFSSQSTLQRTGACFKCKQEGHWASECPQNPR